MVTPSSKNKTNKKHVSSAHIGDSDAHRKMIVEKSDAATYNLHLGDKNPQRDMSHNLLKTDRGFVSIYASTSSTSEHYESFIKTQIKYFIIC